MENISVPGTEDELFELPPGFRFHPTDEELIIHYLSPKALNRFFCARAIGEVDLNKCEPWDLPWRATMGEKEWYFFCLRDKKYPTGSRTNRATDAGYWKATGKDKEIHKAKALIGMKKTLVFYRGRAPQGERTSWVMHEYRLEGKLSENNLPKTAKNEWVICRFFQKSYDRKKMHIPGLLRFRSFVKDPPPSLLPPLIDLAQIDDEKLEPHILASSSSSNPSDNNPPATWTSPRAAPSGSYQSTQLQHRIGNSQYPDCVRIREQSMMRMLTENHGSSTKQNQKVEFSGERDFDSGISSVVYNNGMAHISFWNQQYASASAGFVDIGCLWNH